MTQFCTSCGTQLSDGAVFCHKCGSRIELVKGVPTAFPREDIEAPTTSAAPFAPVPEYRPIHKRPRALGVGVGILLLLIVPIILIAVFGSINFVILGTLNFEYESLAITDVDLIVDNDVGTIDILYDEDITNLFEADLVVRGRPGADIADAKNFGVYNQTLSNMVISFDSGTYQFFFWNKKAFTYDITIRINPVAEVDFNVDADTGTVTFTTNSIDNITIGDLILTSDTGRLDVDLYGSTNTQIDEFDLDTDTGRIEVDLGKNTTLTDPVVDITTDTGRVYLRSEDLISSTSTIWNIDSDTGGITLDIIQNYVSPSAYQATFNVETSTGSITVNFSFNASIGYSFDASTDTGSITLPGPGDYYESLNHDIATNVYDFILDTNTGSVTAQEI
ncbi:MAG: zinc-ribbon domain-containing protein [Candidatus Thorarchaeota archaeon]